MSELLRSSGGGTEASSLLVSTPPVPVSLAFGNRLQGEFSRDCLCLCLPGGVVGTVPASTCPSFDRDEDDGRNWNTLQP